VSESRPGAEGVGAWAVRPGAALAVAVALATAVPFRGAVDLGFVWDDHVLVEANPALSGLAGLGEALGSDLYLGKASGSAASGYWRPVAILSYATNAALGAGPGPLHAGNVLLHAVAAALLAALMLRRVPGAGWAGAGAAALLWALHPLQAEPVAWISCRYDLLTALALLALLLVRPGPGWARATLHGAIFLAGLLSKEGFVAAGAVILADDWAERRSARQALPRWVTVVAAIGIANLGRAALGVRSVLGDVPAAIVAVPRAWLTAVGTYGLRALSPLPLSIGRPHAPLGALGLAASALAVVALVTLALRVRRLAVPVAVFLAGLAPGALASAGLGVAAERYFYVPSIGLAWLVAEGIAAARTRTGRLGAPVGAAATAVVLGAALIGATTVVARLPDWRSDEALFSSALAVDPGEWQSNLNLGVAAAAAGRVEEGRALLERASARNPRSPEVASAVAWVHLLRGDAAAAAEAADRAVRLDPRAPQAHLHLAAALHLAGDHAREREALERAVSLSPGYGPIRVLHAAARCDADPSPGCEADLVRLAGAGGPLAADAAAETCAVLLRRGDRGEARRWLDRLSALAPQHPRRAELERAIPRGR
jgi:hypothetical protein